MKIIENIVILHLILAVFTYMNTNARNIFTDASYSNYEYYDGIEGRFESLVKRSAELPKINFRANCTCGVRPLEQVKIVSGQLAEDHAWPWVVALINMVDPAKPYQFCGSSLINTQYLLTAGHCATQIIQEGLKNFQAYLGVNAISDPTAIKLNISEVKMHPNFNSTTLENDIALIKLNMPVVFSGRVHPICLKQAASPYVEKYTVVVGWGSLKNGSSGVDKLREVKVRVINNVVCATNYSTASIKITGPMMCASLAPKDACQGDSGGPLMIWNPRSKIFCQIGIVSFGLKCGSPFYPGVYARVKTFIKWIQSNTQDASYCQKSF